MKHDDLIARLRRAGANANVGLHGHLMHEAADALERPTTITQDGYRLAEGLGFNREDLHAFVRSLGIRVEGDE